MSLNNARNFVAKLKEDHDFRTKALITSDTEDLVTFLESENLVFTQRELVEAMAECMKQQDLQAELDN